MKKPVRKLKLGVVRIASLSVTPRTSRTHFRLLTLFTRCGLCDNNP